MCIIRKECRGKEKIPFRMPSHLQRFATTDLAFERTTMVELYVEIYDEICRNDPTCRVGSLLRSKVLLCWNFLAKEWKGGRFWYLEMAGADWAQLILRHIILPCAEIS